MLNRLALALVATASMLPLSAHAQEATNTADEEIIVTATKREESIREIPQSVTALTEQTLDRLQAGTFSDYANQVPSLTVTGDQGGNQRITLRGLNTGGVASTVGIYVDETPFGSSSSLVNAGVLALDLDPFDIQRIEVLRGPQGTLYGANTLGGVLRFVTVEPSPAGFESRLGASLEQTQDGDQSWTARAMVNIPMGDQAALRVSGLSRSVGGYVDDPGRGESNVNDVQTEGIRAAFLLNATPDLTIRLSAQYQNIDSGALSDVAYLQSPLRPVAGDLDQFAGNPNTSDITYRIFNGTIDYNLGWASLLSSSSYSELDQHRVEDGTGPFGVQSYLFNDVPQDKFTQEVRLTSPSSDHFEWQVGAFYTREHGALDQNLFVGPNPGGAFFVDAHIKSQYEEEAVFGNVTAHFTPQFDVNIGGRYSQNDQSIDQSGTGVSNGANHSSDSAATFSIAPRFHLNDDVMLYARIASGYRPGGPNIFGAPTSIPLTFDPDTTINYEIGVKSDLFGGALRLDAAAFYIDWSDIQLLVFDGAVSGNANGGGAVSQGFEWSAALRPAEGLSLTWSGAYTDAHLTDDTDPIVVGGASGDPLPYSPDWASTLDVGYEWHVSGDTTAYVGGDWRYVGQQSNGFPGTAGFLYGAQQIQLPSYNLFDLRAGLDFATFSLEVYARNVTDERAVTEFGGYGTTLPDLPNGGAVITRPRTVGVSLTANF